GFRDQLHVHETLPDSRLITFDQPVIRRIDATHARHEYEITGARTEAPGAGRRDRALRRENANAAAGFHHGEPVCSASACMIPPIWPLRGSQTRWCCCTPDLTVSEAEMTVAA